MDVAQPELYASLARIRDTRGAPIGAGFLVGAGLICTCAHVVAEALALDATPRTAPREPIYVDFPYLDGQVRTATTFAWDASVPHRDIALLRVSGLPKGATPAALLSARAAGGRSVKALGFPQGLDMGLWAEAVAQERAANGWVQLVPSERDLLVQPGFSGGPVWDVAGQGVIGMIVATPDPQHGALNVAWAIPIEAVLALEPALRAGVRPPADALGAASLAEDLFERGGFTPIQQLDLSPQARALAGGFAAVGVRWTSLFAFTAALVAADGLTAEAMAALCEEFAALNDGLYRRPQGLGVPWPIWLVGFTLAGAVCFVFERGGAAEHLALFERQQRAAPAYAKGLDSVFWVQTTATSLAWALDVPARRVYRNAGKQPDGSNYSARRTLEELDRLEALLRRRL